MGAHIHTAHFIQQLIHKLSSDTEHNGLPACLPPSDSLLQGTNDTPVSTGRSLYLAQSGISPPPGSNAGGGFVKERRKAIILWAAVYSVYWIQLIDGICN